jgi:hypothetical protein
MKFVALFALLPTLLLALPAAAAPLKIANDAWRSTALTDVAQMLRACVPKAEQTNLPRLPRAQGATDDLEVRQVILEPAQIGQGHWYRVGWRAKDGTVFVVAARSPDGQRTVFGPVDGSWACLPAEIRKELGGR